LSVDFVVFVIVQWSSLVNALNYMCPAYKLFSKVEVHILCPIDSSHLADVLLEHVLEPCDEILL